MTNLVAVLVPLLALILGGLLAIFFPQIIESVEPVYVGVAAVAGLDAVLGGARAAAESRFRPDIFVSGFFTNIVLASGLVFLGASLGVDLYLAAVIALGGRMFVNASVLRRILLTRLADAREQRKMEEGSTQ